MVWIFQDGQREFKYYWQGKVVKRDMDLIKKIMLEIQSESFNNTIQGYEEQQVLYHVKLLINANFVDGRCYDDNSTPKPSIVGVIVRDLTWQGHDFLDVLKDDSKFNTIKDLGKSLSLEAIKSALNQVIQNIL